MLTVAIRPCTGKWADATSIVRVDVPTLAQQILIREDRRLFTAQDWPVADRVGLRDADGQAWWMDATTGQLRKQ